MLSVESVEGVLFDGWIVFPDGVRLPAIPVLDIESCPDCGARNDEFHERGREICGREICPKCFNCLSVCGCLDVASLKAGAKMTFDEIVEEINAIATEYLGETTRLDEIIGATPPAVLRAKLSGFRVMIQKKRAGDYILDKYPDVVLRKWAENGRSPLFVNNANKAIRDARENWFSYFWR